ncbi:hypothetical protein PMAYCL1PPCAC_11712, partial [Pristionchus mayeri]
LARIDVSGLTVLETRRSIGWEGSHPRRVGVSLRPCSRSASSNDGCIRRELGLRIRRSSCCSCRSSGCNRCCSWSGSSCDHCCSCCSYDERLKSLGLSLLDLAMEGTTQHLQTENLLLLVVGSLLH